MKNCPECNLENIDDVSTCTNCGFPFENSTSKILFDNPEKSENTNLEPNNKKAYLNKLKEKFQERTNTQTESFSSNIVESNMNKELISDMKEIKAKLNLFQGRTEAEKGNSKFPDWDIVPPNQFINPRIKPQ